MSSYLSNAEECHKCGHEAEYAQTEQEVGYCSSGFPRYEMGYECESCGAEWSITFELNPVSRSDND
jgi:hypothetical protein